MAKRRTLHLPTKHDVTAEAALGDWPISTKAQARRIVRQLQRRVICLALDDDGGHIEPQGAELAEADVLRSDVEALNADIAAVDIRGCLAPAFRHCLRLGGRYSGVSDGNFQQMSEEERARLTIDGSPDAEVVIHACNLTIFLALTGTRKLPDGDLYARVELRHGHAECPCRGQGMDGADIRFG